MAPPRSTGSSPSAARWLWPIEVERRAIGSSTEVGGPVSAPSGHVVRYILPERLLGPEPADCEVVLGDDYGARVLECALRRASWWLWWTEKPLLAHLRRDAGVRCMSHLPDSLPEAASAPTARSTGSAWIARGVFRTFGAALLPPGSPLQTVVLDAGASLYAETDPNFWIGVPPRTRWSPRALEEWCASAAASSLSLEPFAQGAECLCMVYDGDVSVGVAEADAPALLGALEQWASTRGVILDLQEAPEAP
jgi:hypothetical protein